MVLRGIVRCHLWHNDSREVAASGRGRTREWNFVTREWSRAKVYACAYLVRRLDSNALSCDCELLWLADLLKQYAESGNAQAAATCDYPSQLQGRSVATLTAEELNCGMETKTQQQQKKPQVLLMNVKYSCHTDSHSQPEKGPGLHVLGLARETQLTFGKTCNWRELKMVLVGTGSKHHCEFDYWCMDRWMAAKHSFWLVKL